MELASEGSPPARRTALRRAWDECSTSDHDDTRLEQLDHATLRSLGTTALLRGDVPTLVRAWRGLDDSHQDGLSRMVLGRFHAQRWDMGRALHRLQEAHRWFDEVGFVGVAYADALAHAGELEAAAELLDRFDDPSHDDPFDASVRVRADLLAFQGRYEEALDTYAWMIRRHRSQKVYLHGACLLEHLGRLDDALQVLCVAVTVDLQAFGGLVAEEYVALFERRWRGRNPSLLDAVRGGRTTGASFLAHLEAYRRCLDSLDLDSRRSIDVAPWHDTCVSFRHRLVRSDPSGALVDVAAAPVAGESIVPLAHRLPWREDGYDADVLRTAARLAAPYALLLRAFERTDLLLPVLELLHVARSHTCSTPILEPERPERRADGPASALPLERLWEHPAERAAVVAANDALLLAWIEEGPQLVVERRRVDTGEREARRVSTDAGTTLQRAVVVGEELWLTTDAPLLVRRRGERETYLVRIRLTDLELVGITRVDELGTLRAAAMLEDGAHALWTPRRPWSSSALVRSELGDAGTASSFQHDVHTIEGWSLHTATVAPLAGGRRAILGVARPATVPPGFGQRCLVQAEVPPDGRGPAVVRTRVLAASLTSLQSLSASRTSVAADGSLFVVDPGRVRDSHDEQTGGTLHASSAGTAGRPPTTRWTLVAPIPWRDPDCALLGPIVLVGSVLAGRIDAFDRRTGAWRWTRDADGLRTHIGRSLHAREDQVFFQRQGDQREFLCAVGRGGELRETELSPVDAVVFVRCEGQVLALDRHGILLAAPLPR